MLSTLWIIIKALAGIIAVVFLAGVLILLIQSFINEIFKNM